MDWFILVIVATVLFGLQSFVYQRISILHANKYLVTFIFLFTVFALTLIANFVQGVSFINLPKTIALASLFAIFFYVVTILQMKALEYLPSNLVFPITSSSVFLTVLYSLIFFKESLSLFKGTGIILIFAALVLIRRSIPEKDKKVNGLKGFIIALIVIIPASGMAIVNKYAATGTSLLSFVLLNYLFSSIIALGAFSIKRPKVETNLRTSLLLGVLLGAINFIAYFAFLFSMKTGPLSIISPIQSMGILITIFLSKIFHKEELKLKQLFLVCLSILGVILLRIG